MSAFPPWSLSGFECLLRCSGVPAVSSLVLQWLWRTLGLPHLSLNSLIAARLPTQSAASSCKAGSIYGKGPEMTKKMNGIRHTWKSPSASLWKHIVYETRLEGLLKGTIVGWALLSIGVDGAISGVFGQYAGVSEMKTLLLPSSPSSFCCSFFFAYCRITCMQKVVYIISVGFPGGASGKNLTCQCWRCKRCGFNPWVRKILWRRAWQPTPVFLLGESHGQRSLVGYGPWGHKELDTTEVT